MTTHSGSCHCGRVRYSADIDFSRGSARCNCSVCAKGRMWLIMVPAETFRLEGAEALSTYTFGDRIRHRFCATCGIKPFGEVAGMGIAVNLATLDDIAPETLADIAIHYVDGRNDHYDRSPAVTAYL